MDQHSTLEIRPGRRSRRKAAQRRRLIQHLLASFILAGTALMLVLFLAQPMEPPLVEATLPDKPEPTEEPVHGLEMGKERILAPVAAGRPSGAAEKPADGRTAAGGTSGTGEPPPPFIAIPPAPPVDEPPRAPAVANAKPAPDDHVDDDPPPPPVSTAPPVAVDEELTRPPIEPIVDPACWDGWTYDEDRRECVRNEDPEPADRNEDGEEEEQETVEEEQPSRGDLGGVSKDVEVSR